ncbi:serine-rich adhesin for platelets-like [Eurosta solidaginis]|uniref:serine-rich adhesin for platelets-like n=1 Tax=Eurosta solidaginis TaxID=178769 RepID=UPI003530D8C1
MNNINHHTTNNNNDDDINNGSNNTNTTINTTTTATTTTMTNNIDSVSSNNNNNNNKTNNNSNSLNTLHVNTTTNTLITQETTETDVNQKSIANTTTEIGAAYKYETDDDANLGNTKSGNIIVSSEQNSNDDDNDKCDKFIAHNNKQKIDLRNTSSNADRDKDLSESASTITQSKNPCNSRQPTSTFEQSSSSNSTAVNSITTKAPNVTNTNTNCSNISTNSKHDTNLISNKDFAKCLKPNSNAVAEYSSSALATSSQMQQQTRRHLRTKALLDSLPSALKTHANREGVGDAVRTSNVALIKFYDELFADNNELLQKLSINNPFYRFRKQSTSLKEIRSLTCVERRLRKFRSDSHILSWQVTADDDEEEPNSSDDGERLAGVILGYMNGNAIMVRDDIDYAAQYSAQQKLGETAVQLTATDGSVVVVLDNKHANILDTKPKALNRIEELHSGADGDRGVREFLLDAVATERAFADSAINNEIDSSTVITNPFSIFHDDDALMLSVNTRLRAASSASQQQRTLKKRQRSERSLRRLFEASNEGTSDKRSAHTNTINTYQTGISARQHYLNGIPIGRFERQDFVSTAAALTMKESTKSSKLKPKLTFKNLSLRKIHKSASGLPATTRINPPHACDTISELNALPRMKRLKITYPNRTQSIHSALDADSSAAINIGLAHVGDAASGANKHSYFERIQAKTRQGLQKLRDKCRNLKPGHHQHAAHSSGFTTLAKDDSFRFIGDRARISSYESKCAALNANGTRPHATIYKSYKSEIDLSKNLHYLDAYLEENFDQDLRSTKQSAHSVGRVAAQHRQREKHMDGSDVMLRDEAMHYAKTQSGRAQHKRSNSAAQRLKPIANTLNNYENLGTLPMTKRGCSDSMSSSDYASVFSGPTVAIEPATPSSAGDVETITQTLADDTSSNAGLRYEHPKMSQYFLNKLDLEGSAGLLLAAEGQSISEVTGNCLFSAASEADLDEDDEQTNFDNIGARGDATAFIVDYRRAVNLDVNLSIVANEVDDRDFTQRNADTFVTTRQRHEGSALTDWCREKQQREQQPSAAYEHNSLLAYNENLAESHFYRSLNQHLQQQQQRDGKVAEFDEYEEEKGIGSALLTERMNEDDSDKDFHYKSYLEHFYRAKSGHYERKANSIGYDDERIHITDVANRHEIADYAESGYITRSAFKRAVRGRKAGGSALDLRQSALTLIGDNIRSNNDDRNKADLSLIAHNKRGADCYARQLFGNADGAVAAMQINETDIVNADKMKMLTTANNAQSNLALKDKNSDIMDTITHTEKHVERFGGGNGLSAADYNTPLHATRTRAKTTPFDENLYGATSPSEYAATNRSDNLDVYNEGVGKPSRAAFTTTSAFLYATDALSTSAKLQQQYSGSKSKTSAYLLQQHQRVKQQQQLLTPQATTAALFIEANKHNGKSAKNMEALCGNTNTNSRYMLDSARRQYQQQQHKQKSASSVSSSLSLSTSSSSNSSVSQPVMHNQLQQEQLLLPSNANKIITHGKYVQSQQQQQQLPITGTTSYQTRRSSNTSNASSSDNFNAFIAVRSAKELTSPTAATNAALLQADYAVSTKRTNAYQQQQQRQLIGVHTRSQPATTNNYPTSPSSGGSSSTVPLISALNYYGTGVTTSGGASSTASASASSSSSSSSTNHRYGLSANVSTNASNNYALLAQMHYGNKGGEGVLGTSGEDTAETGAYAKTGPPISPAYASERKPFILEYEC